MGGLNCKNCNCQHKNNNDNEGNELNGDNQNSNTNKEIGEMNFPEQHHIKSSPYPQDAVKQNNDTDINDNNELQTKDDINTLTLNNANANTQNNNNANANISDSNVNNIISHAHRKDIFSNQSDVFLGMEINEDNYKVINNNDIEHSNSNANTLNKNTLTQKQTKTEREDDILYSNRNLENNINLNSNYDDLNSGTTSNMNIYPANEPNSQHNTNNNTISQKQSTPISDNRIKNAKTTHENKIQFGIDRNNVSVEERKLIDEAQNNLNQFYPPEKKEEHVLQSKLSKIELDSFIPKAKIQNIMNSNEVFFHGELKKLINYEISAHKPTLYSSRFCTLTSKTFYYYKSKETYLRKQRPLCAVPLDQITKVSFAKIKKTSKKIDHIIICNRLGIIKNNKKEIERCKLFQDLDLNAYMTAASESGESLIVFTSEIEDTLFKWFRVLNYLLDIINEKDN